MIVRVIDIVIDVSRQWYSGIQVIILSIAGLPVTADVATNTNTTQM